MLNTNLQIVILSSMASLGFIEKVSFEERLEGGKGVGESKEPVERP